MKRSVYFASVMILLDQILKYLFQIFLYGRKEYFSGSNLGVTFVINPGIYINQNISNTSVLILQIVEILALIIIFFFFKAMKSKLDTSLLLDMSFGFASAGLLGNLVIDKMLFGGIRDYFITPYGVANFADICGILGLSLFSFELIRIKYQLYRIKYKAEQL